MPKREDVQWRSGCSGLAYASLLQRRGASYAPGKTESQTFRWETSSVV